MWWMRWFLQRFRRGLVHRLEPEDAARGYEYATEVLPAAAPLRRRARSSRALRPAGTSRRRAGAAGLVGVLACGLGIPVLSEAQQNVEPSFEVQPPTPSEFDEVTLEIRFASAQQLEVASVEVAEFRIEIELLPEGPCLITCPPFDQTAIVPLGSLAAGLWEVSIDLDGIARIEGQFEVSAASPYRPSLSVLPSAPEAQEFVVLGLNLVVDDCIATEPGLTALEILPAAGQSEARAGTVEVTLTRVVPGVPCDPLPLRPVSLLLPVGALAEGEWRVEVGLIDLAVPRPPSAWEAVERQRSSVSGHSVVRHPAFSDAGIEMGDAVPIAVFDFEVAPPDPVVLLDDRFEVSATWWSEDPSRQRAASPAPLLASEPLTTIFTFYDPRNWELLVKVLDGCALNGHRWVFAAAATDLGYSIVVRDRQTDETFGVENPLGVASAATTEVLALPCE